MILNCRKKDENCHKIVIKLEQSYNFAIAV
jgi:hypothetical protein